MDSKPQLVLDLAGVLITNLSSSFWQELARHAGTPFPVLIEQLSAIRKDLWTGRLTEKQFWFWMQTQYPNMDKLYAYELLEKTTELLPAIHRLERWSEQAELHLLSNHCQEWIQPILPLIQPYCKSITISNQVGYCKPNIEIYELVQSHLARDVRIIYVDDQAKNLKPAAELGWETLLADEQHHWIAEIDTWLAYPQ